MTSAGAVDRSIAPSESTVRNLASPSAPSPPRRTSSVTSSMPRSSPRVRSGRGDAFTNSITCLPSPNTVRVPFPSSVSKSRSHCSVGMPASSALRLLRLNLPDSEVHATATAPPASSKDSAAGAPPRETAALQTATALMKSLQACALRTRFSARARSMCTE